MSYARNTGATVADASILASTDDDQHVAPTWISTNVAVLAAQPDVDAVYHHLDAGRLTKQRFREWHACEGRMRAGYAFDELFTRGGEIRPLPHDTPRLFGVSRFMYRRLAAAIAAYAWAVGSERAGDVFARELRMRYLWAYIVRRRELADSEAQAPVAPSALGRLWRTSVTIGSRVFSLFFIP